MALFWESLDQNLDLGNRDDPSSTFMDYAHAIALPKPIRKLRKQRSQPNFTSPSRLSLISDTPSRLRRRILSSSTLCLPKRATQPLPLDLPNGLEQIGSGIGFTYTLPTANRSKASICSTTPRNCHAGLSRLGLNLALRIKKRPALPQRPALDFDSNAYTSSGWNIMFPLGSPQNVNYDSPLTGSDRTALDSPLSEPGPLTPTVPTSESQEPTVRIVSDVDGGGLGAAKSVGGDVRFRTLRLVSPSPFAQTSAFYSCSSL